MTKRWPVVMYQALATACPPEKRPVCSAFSKQKPATTLYVDGDGGLPTPGYNLCSVDGVVVDGGTADWPCVLKYHTAGSVDAFDAYRA